MQKVWAVLIVLLLAPLASGSDPVSLSTNATTATTTASADLESFQFAGSADGANQNLFLGSVLRNAAGESINHQTQWSLDGRSTGSSRTQEGRLDQVGQATVNWVVTADLPAGSYRLELYIREASAANTISARVFVDLSVQPPPSSSPPPPSSDPDSSSTSSSVTASTTVSSSTSPSESASSTTSRPVVAEEVRRKVQDVLPQVTDLGLEDEDGDGRIDTVRVSSSNGTTNRSRVAAGDAALVDVDDGTGAKSVVVDLRTGEVFVPTVFKGDQVRVQAKSPGATSASQELPRFDVTVTKETGWIRVEFEDPAPDQALQSIVRDDGVVISTQRAFREDGMIVFIDDPEATYTFEFAPQPDAARTQPKETPFGFIGFVVLGAVALALRRRHA